MTRENVAREVCIKKTKLYIYICICRSTTRLFPFGGATKIITDYLTRWSSATKKRTMQQRKKTSSCIMTGASRFGGTEFD